MGQKNISAIIGGFIIAASILVGAFLMSDSSSAAKSNSEPDVFKGKSVFTIDDLAGYLSVSDSDIEKIIKKDYKEKAEIEEGDFDTYKYIPYINLAGEKRFLKSEIDKWLEYQSVNN